jgi:NADH-quinone oxidoreductase subunit N
MNTIAFGIVAYLGSAGETEMSHYRGLVRRQPLLAVGMSIAMISLMGLGIPGTVGFMGKYMVLKEAMAADLIVMAVATIVGSSISAYYYLRLVVEMFMQEEDVARPVAGNVLVAASSYRIVILLAVAMTVVFGFLPLLFFAFQIG